MSDAKIIQEAHEALFGFDQAKAVNLVKQAVARKDNLLDLLNQAFIPAINEIGEKFSMGEMFLLELIQAAEVMKKVTAEVSAALPKEEAAGQSHGTIVMGTVQRDIHDIGKTLVVIRVAEPAPMVSLPSTSLTAGPRTFQCGGAAPWGMSV